MNRTSRLEVVDSLTGGRLALRVGQLRDEGVSYEGIAERVRREFDIPTTAPSVYRWWTALQAGDPSKPRQAS